MMKSNEYQEVADLGKKLVKRVYAEINNVLLSQLEAMGIAERNTEMCQRAIHPDDPFTLVSYKYKDQLILVVKISENRMGVEFVTPKLKPETQKREVQHEKQL